MTHSVAERQSELPRFIPLCRYAPDRARFSWQNWSPVLVKSATDLPQYLILGRLEPSSFQISAGGWSARWQGTEDDTHFDVTYRAEVGQWEVRQTWRGLEGGFTVYPARIPLNKLIGQALYMQFPRNWDREAKSQLELEYQITLVDQPENAYKN